MSETFKYLSREWQEEVQRRVKKELTPKQMKKVTAVLVNKFKKCPDGKDRYMMIKYEKGELAEFTVNEGTPPKSAFGLVGSYSVFAQVNRNEFSAKTAVLTGKLKLEGSKFKALKLASITETFGKILASIPTEY